MYVLYSDESHQFSRYFAFVNGSSSASKQVYIRAQTLKYLCRLLPTLSNRYDLALMFVLAASSALTFPPSKEIGHNRNGSDVRKNM